jgi:hypothetical protein
MKRFLKVLTLAAAAIVAQVQSVNAQLVGPFSVDVVANVTSNTPLGVVTIDCRGQQNVAIRWTVQLGGAGTEIMGVRFQPSADASALATTPAVLGYQMAIAANGTTAVNVTTNFATLGYPFLHLYYATNGNASSVMSNRFNYWVSKTGAK